jgi:hypothetical protein
MRDWRSFQHSPRYSGSPRPVAEIVPADDDPVVPARDVVITVEDSRKMRQRFARLAIEQAEREQVKQAERERRTAVPGAMGLLLKGA